MLFDKKYAIIRGDKVDKITTGFLRTKGNLKAIKQDLISMYEEICLADYGVKAKVTVKFNPIAEIVKNPEDRLDFTHAYSIRCRG